MAALRGTLTGTKGTQRSEVSRLGSTQINASLNTWNTRASVTLSPDGSLRVTVFDYSVSGGDIGDAELTLVVGPERESGTWRDGQDSRDVELYGSYSAGFGLLSCLHEQHE